MSDQTSPQCTPHSPRVAPFTPSPPAFPTVTIGKLFLVRILGSRAEKLLELEPPPSPFSFHPAAKIAFSLVKKISFSTFPPLNRVHHCKATPPLYPMLLSSSPLRFSVLRALKNSASCPPAACPPLLCSPTLVLFWCGFCLFSPAFFFFFYLSFAKKHSIPWHSEWAKIPLPFSAPAPLLHPEPPFPHPSQCNFPASRHKKHSCAYTPFPPCPDNRTPENVSPP